ncbi:MAG: hypothetical protein QXM43_06500 [Desulfurococcaceae archaeon]
MLYSALFNRVVYLEKGYLSKEYWIRSSRRCIEYAMKTTGNVRTLMITVDFPNAPYTEAPAAYRDPLLIQVVFASS